MCEQQRTVIENLKTRLLQDYLGQMRAFVDTATIANLLGVTESLVDEIMENGTMSYVMIEGVPLIPIITLLDEMEWFPSEFYKTDHGNEEVQPLMPPSRTVTEKEER